jgi:PAT family beta-lactamase induction signal transducer AmpG
MLFAFIFGISSGIPLLLTGSTLQAWMTESGVDLKMIGAFALVGVPYSLKFLWSPYLDMFSPRFFGRRKSWIFIFQLALIFSLILLGQSNPAANPLVLCLSAFLVTFFSASQDIVVDAYRREILTEEELGLGSSLYVNGYRIGMLIAGAIALRMAENLPWSTVYIVMASMMGVMAILTIFAPMEDHHIERPRSFKSAVLDPFKEYFSRDQAILILFFILLYKVGDSMASNMTTPYILKLGYTKTQLADVVKIFGLSATIIGGLLGGTLIFKWGLSRSLWIFGILQAISTLGFNFLSTEASVGILAAVIAFENIASGLGTAAYSAYMASLTNKKFTGTQYALLTSLMGASRTIISAPAGVLAEKLGWNPFFIVCALMAIPGMYLLRLLQKNSN